MDRPGLSLKIIFLKIFEIEPGTTRLPTEHSTTEPPAHNFSSYFFHEVE